MKYTIDYFIKKFKAIPDKMWTVGTYGTKDGPKCALGHCRKWLDGNSSESTLEVNSLFKLFKKYKLQGPQYYNDESVIGFPQETPKARILAVLNYIKNLKKKRKN